MRILFMDISRNDDGEVLSVLGGCRKCGNRIITCFIDETWDWLKDHHKRLHYFKELSGIDQIGDPLKLAEPKVDRDQLLPNAPKVHRIVALLKEADEGMTVSAIAETLDSSYNTVSVSLNRLHKAGKVRKEKFESANFWKAA